MVGVHEPRRSGHDPVAVGVGVVGEGHVEAVLERDQAGHGVRRRGVHSDPAVPVDGHERELGIDDLVGDGQVQAVAVADRGPVADARPAQRIDSELQAGGADRLHVQDAGQIGHVDAGEVVAAHLPDGLLVRQCA